MARVKRSINARKKRRTTLDRAKGYYGAKSRTYTKAKEQVQHSLQYQYRDRRNKKREIRKLWITRINAGARAERHVLLRVHERPEEGRRRARPQGALRHGHQRPRWRLLSWSRLPANSAAA